MLISKDAQCYDWSYCINEFFHTVLSFDLLPSLYFTVVNSDLELRRLAEKQRVQISAESRKKKTQNR